MGDSITEGTIASWEKSVGDSVSVDDVVAVIETDKVAVEVRAEVGGSVAELFAEVDGTVQVGQDLVSIHEADNAAPPKAATEEKPQQDDSPKLKRAHVPLIKFLGKRSLLKQEAPPPPQPSPEAAAAPPAPPQGRPPVLHDFYLYVRPNVSEEEIDAVQSGGASFFP